MRAHGVDLGLLQGVLGEAIEVGEGAVEGRGGHVSVRLVGVHGGLRLRQRLRRGAGGERRGQRRARDLHPAAGGRWWAAQAGVRITRGE